MTIIAALPRSSLHLQLLAANDPGVTHVLYRDDHIAEQVERLFPGKGLALGRESRPPRNPLALPACFAANRRYYASVRERLAPLGIERLILFLEGEPLERMLAHWFSGPVELWEDGLSHYVDLTSPLWYGARGAVQIASGFYPRGAMKRRADRSTLTIRDRFDAGGLTLPAPVPAPPQPRILIIGSPLAEDGIVPRSRVAEALRTISAASPLPAYYLPHPREDGAALAAMIEAIDELEVAPLPHGIGPHVEAHGYAAYVSAASTALLDLGQFRRSLFVPRIFGLERMHRALQGWQANPVAIGADIDGLTQNLRRICGQPASAASISD